MKKIFFTWMIIFLSIMPSLQSQVFKCIPVAGRNNQVDEVFKNAEMYRIPFHQINEFIKGRSNGTEITLQLGSKIHTWKIYENNLLPPDFKLTTWQHGKYIEMDYDKSCRTYVGYRNDRAESARFTISAKNFAAMIPDGNSYLFIQSAGDFDEEAAEDIFVAYSSTSLIGSHPSACTVARKPVKENQEEKRSGKKDIPNTGSRTFNCLEIEISLATDNRMFNTVGSAEELLDFNLTVLNMMEPYYNDFDIDFWVREYFMVTGYLEEDNPWGEATEVDDLIADFGDWAYDYFATEDLGHLWSGANLHDSEEYGTIGYASVGGACDDFGVYPWSLLERFSITNLYTLSILNAHEYGHLLDADHEEDSGTIMEPSINNVECSCWDPDNVEEMWDFIEDESCIEPCIQCPISYNIIDYIAWGDWRYSAIDHINSTAVIDSVADVIFQTNIYIKLTPGFSASSAQPSSGGSTFVAKIAGCE